MNGTQKLQMKEFVSKIEKEFGKRGDPKVAAWQKAYLRNQFEFFGLSSKQRREIQKPFLAKNSLPAKSELAEIVNTLWQKPQRDFQYLAQEMAFKYAPKFTKNDIALFEYMVINKSWWETVDVIAPKLMGEYFKMYPQQISVCVEKWLKSNNIWLQRSAILFQLKYKSNLDTQLLSHIINSLLDSKEFFINKAIGWILREYAKVNPKWVLEFANKTQLSNLSKREALRIIKVNDDVFKK